MTIFTGTHYNKLDGKGRLSLPANFRSNLLGMDEFFLFPSPRHKALEACSRSLMEKIDKSILEQSEVFSELEDNLSWILAESRSVTLDSTGRFVLPQEFLEIAEVTPAQDVVFVGRGQRFQLWSPENFNQYKRRLKTSENIKMSFKLLT